jgi:GNAT superfamily N-acetyltransferase
MEILIRHAEMADYSGFLRVAHEVHEHHVALIPEVFRSVTMVVPENYYERLITADESEILVAECDGEIVGYAVLLHRSASGEIRVPRSFSFIDNFGVAKAYRRKGVARQLFEACLAIARERGDDALELDCWEPNEDALRFYEAMGMRTTRRWFSIDL